MCWYVLIHIYAFTGVAMNPGYINASMEQILVVGYIYLLLLEVINVDKRSSNASVCALA